MPQHAQPRERKHGALVQDHDAPAVFRETAQKQVQGIEANELCRLLSREPARRADEGANGGQRPHRAGGVQRAGQVPHARPDDARTGGEDA